MEINDTCLFCGRNDRRPDALRNALNGLLKWIAKEHAKDGWNSRTTPDAVVHAALTLEKGDRPCT